MSQYREFSGKDLDEAIQTACSHFQLDRSGLEIDIVSGGSSGIFGLVGKKPAMVRARPLTSKNIMDADGQSCTRCGGCSRTSAPTSAITSSAGPVSAADYDPDEDEDDNSFNRVDLNHPGGYYSAPETTDDEFYDDEDDDVGNRVLPAQAEEPGSPIEDKELEAFLLMAAAKLVEPIIGPTNISVSQSKDRLRVHLEDTDDSGLLIGRDGQTLNAVQYLLNRMVGRRWPDAPRVQVDTGDYRQRQDDKLRSIAHSLAQRASSSGKVQSTKPLSSYHRRIIHLALQNHRSVTTKSKGDGPLKRVLILPRRPGRSREA